MQVELDTAPLPDDFRVNWREYVKKHRERMAKIGRKSSVEQIRVLAAQIICADDCEISQPIAAFLSMYDEEHQQKRDAVFAQMMGGNVKGVDNIAYDLLFKYICVRFGFKKIEVLSKRKNKELAFARHWLFGLCKYYTTMSLTEIGNKCDMRDHSTVWHSQRKFEYWMARGEFELWPNLLVKD